MITQEYLVLVRKGAKREEGIEIGRQRGCEDGSMKPSMATLIEEVSFS